MEIRVLGFGLEILVSGHLGFAGEFKVSMRF